MLKLLPSAPQTHEILTSAVLTSTLISGDGKEAEEAPAILTAETSA